ncbi:MAG: DUF58 domain-containing protein [Treponema sp.]|nr:DUF58 domain-containing protein [Spirochaetaceae bacterium]MEE0132517.1 DUF58 domain-containing protein [Treponema sp.]
MERNTLDGKGLHSQSLVKRASSLQVTSRTLFESLRSGSFKSIYKGRGIEFSGVREYFLGDDVRSIDWNVTARMGRPFVKQFEEDRELVLFLVVDGSLSMATGGGKLARNRLHTGCEVAALMALAASLGGGSVGGVIFDGDIRYSHKPRAGNNQALMFLNQLEAVLQSPEDEAEKEQSQLSLASPGSNLHKALRGAASLLKKRSLVLVVSDFRTAGYQQDLAILASRHDVIAVRITDPVDYQLEGVGSLPFVDPESGYRRVLPTSSTSFQQAWKDADKKRVERWKSECYRRGAWPLTISTQEDVAVALQRFFSGRET